MERMQITQWIKHNKRLLILLAAMLTFKISLDLSYWHVLTLDNNAYVKDFSAAKYLLSMTACCALFFAVPRKPERVSTAMLYLVFMLQILPISTIYALGNDSTVFYLSICISFLLCELIVGYLPSRTILPRSERLSRIMCFGFAAAVVIALIAVIVENGLPSLLALNIFRVYELRRSGDFQLNKYANYLMIWSVKVILPMGIAIFLLKKKYVFTAVLCSIVFLFYLYTGHKTYLFSLPLVLACTLWAQRKHFFWELYTTAQLGFASLSFLTCLFAEKSSVIANVFSLLIRRSMIVPARNKFLYFDYFSNNPKMGFAGVFPRWLIPVYDPYETIEYTYEIGRIYYGSTITNVNTGFLGEGFMRFGHFGTVLNLVIFAFLMRQVDKLQDRVGYALAVGIFIYPVFGLADEQLFTSIFFGAWMLLVGILVFYTKKSDKDHTKIVIRK